MSSADGVPGPLATSVVLVGFMGAGKSTVGKALAVRCGVPFIDCDEVVEREHGPIDTIFLTRGEPAFRAVEREVVLRVLDEAETSPRVVALGGGAVTSDAVRLRLAGFAYVIWLDAPPDDLWRRAGGGATASRPLARDREAFARLLEQRRPLYAEVSRLTVSVCGDVADAIDDILQRTGLASTGPCAGREEGER